MGLSRLVQNAVLFIESLCDVGLFPGNDRSSRFTANCEASGMIYSYSNKENTKPEGNMTHFQLIITIQRHAFKKLDGEAQLIADPF